MDYIEFSKRRKINLVICRDDEELPLDIFNADDFYPMTIHSDGNIYLGEGYMELRGGTYAALRIDSRRFEVPKFQLYVRDLDGTVLQTDKDLINAGLIEFFKIL